MYLLNNLSCWRWLDMGDYVAVSGSMSQTDWKGKRRHTQAYAGKRRLANAHGLEENTAELPISLVARKRTLHYRGRQGHRVWTPTRNLSHYQQSCSDRSPSENANTSVDPLHDETTLVCKLVGRPLDNMAKISKTTYSIPKLMTYLLTNDPMTLNTTSKVPWMAFLCRIWGWPCIDNT